MMVRSVAPFFGGFNLAPDRINEDFIRLEWNEKGVDKYFNDPQMLLFEDDQPCE